MKILFVSTISNTINAFLIPHIKMLINDGHKVDVAFNIEQEVKPEIIEMGCKIYEVQFQRSPFKIDNIKAYKELKRIIIDEKYDVVHTHTPVASTISRLVCRNLNSVRLFYTAHGFHFFKGAPIKNWLVFYPIEKTLAKYTDVLITMNEEDYGVVTSKQFKAKNVIKVNGVGVSFEKFVTQTDNIKYKLREEYGYSHNDFILIYVGELSYRKHQDLLISAVAKTVNSIPNIRLLLVGDGSLRNQYNNLIKALGIEKNVELLGYRKDVSKLMLLSDISVSSSRQEGLPVNVMEGMATGLPLIVTNCRGNRDLVKEEFNGYIIDMDNDNMMSKKIEDIYKDEQKRTIFAKNNLELIEQYSLEHVLDEMRDVYNKFLQ